MEDVTLAPVCSSCVLLNLTFLFFSLDVPDLGLCFMCCWTMAKLKIT